MLYIPIYIYVSYIHKPFRIAQEIFLQSNVSLVLNVKAKIMDKLCRFLQADPMYSIDDLVVTLFHSL